MGFNSRGAWTMPVKEKAVSKVRLKTGMTVEHERWGAGTLLARSDRMWRVDFAGVERLVQQGFLKEVGK